jgi:TolB protein
VPAGCLLALGGLGVLAGLAVALLLAVPRVTGLAPAPQDGPASSLAPVRITFNVPMDTAATEAALAITPARAGSIRWEGNTLVFVPGSPWPLGEAVSVRLAGGRSRRGLPLLGSRSWSFSVGQPRLAYLAGTPANLWLTALRAGATPQALTDEPQGIYDYAVSPDGAQIVYAARRADGGADLRAIGANGQDAHEVLACPEEACVSPAFAPDGLRLAYQRYALTPGLGGGNTLGASRVRMLTLATGADEAVSENEARFPAWGPDGRLSYLDLQRSAIVVHDLATGAVTYIPTTSGETGAWSSDGQAIVFPELYQPSAAAPTLPAEGASEEAEGRFYTYLVRVTIATNATQNLSGEGVVDDGSPSFSPGGNWIAFGRKTLFLGQWTPGRQLWLMRPDGSDAHALTADPLYNHSAFRWSPGGTALACMRFNTAEPNGPAEIWVVELQPSGQAESAGARRLGTGYLPEWLP